MEISYRHPDVVTDSINNIYLQAKISLKQNADAVAIHFKVLNSETNVVVYQVNYPFTQTLIIEPDGKIIFKKEAELIYINSPDLILHSTYKYVITTDNTQNELSEEYTDIQ